MAKSGKAKMPSKSMYTMHEAKTNLSKLVEQVQNGEHVIIANGKKPVAKLVPIDGPPYRRAGALKGLFSWTDDAFDPLTDEEMKELGFE
jgi:prevent-host-death family protein